MSLGDRGVYSALQEGDFSNNSDILQLVKGDHSFDGQLAQLARWIAVKCCG